MPVQPEPCRAAAEATGGQAYEAATEAELTTSTSASRRARRHARRGGRAVIEDTWKWAAGRRRPVAAGWALSMWWLRGMV